jgi:hypothetical protein
LISLALYGGENTPGIENIRRVYMSMFSDMRAGFSDDSETGGEFPKVENCQKELEYMINKLGQFESSDLYAKAKAFEWAEDYECLNSEGDFTIMEFAKELLEVYLEDGGMGITGFNGPYTPGNMELFKKFFDKDIEDIFE